MNHPESLSAFCFWNKINSEALICLFRGFTDCFSCWSDFNVSNSKRIRTQEMQTFFNVILQNCVLIHLVQFVTVNFPHYCWCIIIFLTSSLLSLGLSSTWNKLNIPVMRLRAKGVNVVAVKWWLISCGGGGVVWWCSVQVSRGEVSALSSGEHRCISPVFFRSGHL